MKIKKINLILFILMLLLCASNKPVVNNKAQIDDLKWLWSWIDTWNTISKSTFGLENTSLPKILFYDDKYVYTNSKISAPDGTPLSGPKLYDQEINWVKQVHNDILILPDSKLVPLQLMTFASPMKSGSYFVMPSPGYWGKAELKNDIVSTETMLNGIFVHEFAHTRQITSIAQKLIDFQQSSEYNYPINDDLLKIAPHIGFWCHMRKRMAIILAHLPSDFAKFRFQVAKDNIVNLNRNYWC